MVICYLKDKRLTWVSFINSKSKCLPLGCFRILKIELMQNIHLVYKQIMRMESQSLRCERFCRGPRIVLPYFLPASQASTCCSSNPLRKNPGNCCRLSPVLAAPMSPLSSHRRLGVLLWSNHLRPASDLFHFASISSWRNQNFRTLPLASCVAPPASWLPSLLPLIQSAQVVVEGLLHPLRSSHLSILLVSPHSWPPVYPI